MEAIYMYWESSGGKIMTTRKQTSTTEGSLYGSILKANFDSFNDEVEPENQPLLPQNSRVSEASHGSPTSPVAFNPDVTSTASTPFPPTARKYGPHLSQRDLVLKRKRNATIIIGVTFVLFYPFLIFACMALPTWWSGFTRSDIESYQSSTPSKSYGWYWSWTITDNVVLKLFPDIMIFYGTIYLVSCVALLAASYEPLHEILRSRSAYLPSDTTVGETLLAVS
jgi:hypothetical protein